MVSCSVKEFIVNDLYSTDLYFEEFQMTTEKSEELRPIKNIIFHWNIHYKLWVLWVTIIGVHVLVLCPTGQLGPFGDETSDQGLITLEAKANTQDLLFTRQVTKLQRVGL